MEFWRSTASFHLVQMLASSPVMQIGRSRVIIAPNLFDEEDRRIEDRCGADPGKDRS
jgi:hypothetical protein